MDKKAYLFTKIPSYIFFEDSLSEDENKGQEEAEDVVNEGDKERLDPSFNLEEKREQEELEEESPAYRTLFEEEGESQEDPLAHIDFGVEETGRWLLKVIGGPNNGAEFYMHSGKHYFLGTDPQSCDILFHDKSVSRQHAKIDVTEEDTLFIEDLKSRNGIMLDGKPVEGKQPLPLGSIITMGTTAFAVYDREGEMQTIISPLLPSIVKVLQQDIPDEKPEVKPAVENIDSKQEDAREKLGGKETTLPAKPQRSFANFVILSAIIGLFTLAAMGTTSLFHSPEPVTLPVQENADELIKQALNPFPSVRYTFNKANGSILLLGHVANLSDKNQLLYNLQGLKFIKNVDDAGIVIDEYVWQEINSILAENPTWKGISIHSPAAGQFILSGYLKTRKQAEQLSSYMSLNFPYLDLLKKQVVVEEDVDQQIAAWLNQAQLSGVTGKMVNGEVTLTGKIPTDKVADFQHVIEQIKGISGTRVVNNLVRSEKASVSPAFVNISHQYQITGRSRIGNQYTVVVNGHILGEGDELDGMLVTQITPNRIMLEKGETKYQIDY